MGTARRETHTQGSDVSAKTPLHRMPSTLTKTRHQLARRTSLAQAHEGPVARKG